MTFGNVHGIDEARACTIDVDTRTGQTYHFCNYAAQSRSDIFVDYVRADEIVDVFRFESGHFQCFQRCLRPQIFKFLIADHVPGMNSSPRDNPFITGVQKFRKHRVRHDLFRKSASGSDKFHNNSVQCSSTFFVVGEYPYDTRAAKIPLNNKSGKIMW